VKPKSERTAEFLRQLPERYRTSFDLAAVEEHAALWADRGQKPCRIAASRSARFPGQCLVVLADDRPGLLATICACLVGEGLSVVAAEAYTRGLGQRRREAVDVFWVENAERGRARPCTGTELCGKLEARLEERLRLDPSAAVPSVFPPGVAENAEATVRFLEDRRGRLSTLEVEATDRVGLLLCLAKALFGVRVQIVSSRIRTEEGRVRDSFELAELDDTPISLERRFVIQAAVLAALS